MMCDFFIADRVKAKEIRIKYCPMGIMVADYFTKPLQGTIFRELRDMIMGNTIIALPTDTVAKSIDMTGRIPTVLPPSESRSVLSRDDAIDSLPCSLTVLPIRNKPARVPTSNDVPIGTSTVIQKVMNGFKPSNLVNGKRAISWAEIVSRCKECSLF
jgi:hypothetical protein